MHDEFNLDSIGVVHAVEYAIPGRGHGIWVVDGQHRLKVLTDVGFGEWEVDVMIHLSVTSDDEASKLFLHLDDMLRVNQFDKFEQSWRAGDTQAVAIHDILEARNLRVAKYVATGTVRAVASLNKVYKLGGEFALTHTLDAILASWGMVPEAVDARVLDGLGLLFATRGAKIDPAYLVKRLSKYPGGPAKLIRDTQGMKNPTHPSMGHCLAEIVTRVYNAGRPASKIANLQ